MRLIRSLASRVFLPLPALAALCLLAACGSGDSGANGPGAQRTGEAVPVHSVEVVAKYALGKEYVQGFLMAGPEHVWISTGAPQGAADPSRVFKVKLVPEGEEVPSPEAYRTMEPLSWFGEGLVRWKDDLIWLTYRQKTGIVLDATDPGLRRKTTFPYGDSTEQGWGLTHDGEQLVMSNGSAELILLDPKSYKETGRLKVKDGFGVPVDRLNELEFVKGEIWANRYQTTEVVCIDPETGKLTRRIDAAKLAPEGLDVTGEEVLNGIAYDAENDRIFFTGKNWGVIYEVKVVSGTP